MCLIKYKFGSNHLLYNFHKLGLQNMVKSELYFIIIYDKSI